ncbi:MAG: hypothetical protein R3C68_01870 [Myxococcota bacterium]
MTAFVDGNNNHIYEVRAERSINILTDAVLAANRVWPVDMTIDTTELKATNALLRPVAIFTFEGFCVDESGNPSGPTIAVIDTQIGVTYRLSMTVKSRALCEFDATKPYCLQYSPA